MGIPDMVASLAIKAGIIPKPGSTRVMKFAYTTPAQIGLFPWRLYWEKNWLFRYWIYGVLISFPVFRTIGKMSRSPENYAKMNAIKAKDHHHED